MKHVTLLGHQNHGHMLELYACCDILLLPSLRETYGFVTVEGLYAGLPLLISERVGATPEVLVSGSNGWSFDPNIKGQIIQALDSAISVGQEGLAAMGRRSHEIAVNKFYGRRIVREFADSLMKVIPS